VFRSAAADISSKFFAKDMHTGERDMIEEQIRDRMREQLDERGIVIEAVLMKSIRLPERLSVAISEKLEAEQDAQRMEFVLAKERQEAERRRVEAEGIRDAQLIISEGLTPLLIQREQIEAFRELATSPNAKVIITDGESSTPVLLESPE
jgi:regulator of protease activity HflC (stomatin/prohibitin superfamily)